MADENPHLHDLVRFACTKRDRLIANKLFEQEPRSLMDAKINEVRNAIISTNRFVLTNNLVEAAVEISGGDPAFMLRAIPSALPPSGSCWFEWNDSYRTDLLGKTGQVPTLDEKDRSVAEKVGVLIQKQERPGTDTLYSISVISANIKDEPEGHVHLHPMAYLCDFENSEFTRVMTADEIVATSHAGRYEKKTNISIAMGGAYFGYHLYKRNNVTKPEEVLKFNNFINDRFAKWDDIESPDNSDELNNAIRDVRIGMEITRHVRYKYFGPFGAFVRNNLGKLDSLDDLYGDINGDFRFVLAVLILFNTFAFQSGTTKLVKPKRKKLLAGRNIPYMDYHNVVIDLPKEKLISTVEEYVGDSLNDERRRHRVIEHWCYRKNSGSKTCEHEWIRQRDRLVNIWHHCHKCGRVRWRRKEHERGNAEVGFVIKNYIVESTENRGIKEI